MKMFGDVLHILSLKIIRYFNHHFFLRVCSSLDIVPNGLMIDKKPCVGEISQESNDVWYLTLGEAGKKLVEILREEYRFKLRQALTDFWNLVR